MGFVDSLGRSLGAPGPQLLLGTVVRVDTATGVLTVSVGGVEYTDLLVADAGLSPTTGDPVLLLRQGDMTVILGLLTAWLPPYGTVTATGATTCTVDVPGYGTIALPFLVSYSSRSVGDVVDIKWHGSTGRGVITGELSASPTSPTSAASVTPPPQTPTYGTTTFVARSAGTYRSGTWRTDANGDVIQGTAPGYAGLNEGAWFYHGAIRSTLAGATVTGARIYLGRTSGGVYAAQNCHIYRVANNSRPSGALTFGTSGGSIAIPVNTAGWYVLPSPIAQELVDSGGSIGIKAPSGPYMRMYGLSKSRSAGAVRIGWKR